jgi:hypothetical protein
MAESVVYEVVMFVLRWTYPRIVRGQVLDELCLLGSWLLNMNSLLPILSP